MKTQLLLTPPLKTKGFSYEGGDYNYPYYNGNLPKNLTPEDKVTISVVPCVHSVANCGYKLRFRVNRAKPIVKAAITPKIFNEGDYLHHRVMSNALRKCLIALGCTYKSPYSNSWYNNEDKDWNCTPTYTIRCADHWNFKSKKRGTPGRAALHCKTTFTPKDGYFSIAYYKGGKYHLLYEFKKNEPKKYEKFMPYYINKLQEFKAKKRQAAAWAYEDDYEYNDN